MTEQAEINITYTPAQMRFLFGNAGAKFVIVTKGRRFGGTQGIAHYYIENALDGVKLQLWVDTVHGNIVRYYDRYFRPILEQLVKVGVKVHWNERDKVLKINEAIIDFRSADAPDSIDGFGYSKIFINEA